MQTIKRDIYVTKNVLQAPIEVTEGTNSIAIEFDVRDFDIPASAAAVAYSLSTSSMEEPNKALADVSGNKITIIPSETFFLPGQNVMQIRIIDGNSKLISFNIIVKCTGKMRFGDEKEEQQSTLVEQILAKLGEYTGKLDAERKRIDNLDSTKANKTDLTSPYNFKGSCLSSALPASGNTVNDTYYCTDLKYRKTWNGSAWEQSSLNEADYEDELTKTNGEVSSLKEDLGEYEKNIVTEFEPYGNVVVTYENNDLKFSATHYSGTIWKKTLWLQDIIDNVYISGILKCDEKIDIGLFNTSNGFKGQVGSIPSTNGAYKYVECAISKDSINALGQSSFKLSFLSNSRKVEFLSLNINLKTFSSDTVKKEFERTKIYVGKGSKKYEDVGNFDNLFISTNLNSYGGNSSFEYLKNKLTIINSSYDGVYLGTFELGDSNSLYLSAIVNCFSPIYLGIFDTSNDYKGAIPLNKNRGSNSFYAECEIPKTLLQSYSLTGKFKLALLTESKKTIVDNLVISLNGYKSNSLDIEIDTIKKILSNNESMNYLYVSTEYNESTDGYGVSKFKSIYEANETIKNASKENPYTIIVKNGNYTDLNDRYSGVKNVTGTYQGIVPKDYVYYESENINRPDLCVIQFNGATGIENPTNDDVNMKAPFHILGDKLHTHIKGFTFSVKNTRYAIHVESTGKGIDKEWEISNCVFNWYGRPDVVSGAITPCIGIGMSPFEIGRIKNCKIKNWQSNNNQGISVHNNDFSNSYNYTPFLKVGSHLSIENCNLNGSSIGCNTSNTPCYDTFDIVEVKNCRGVKSVSKSLINGQKVHSYSISVENSEVELTDI